MSVVFFKVENGFKKFGIKIIIWLIKIILNYLKHDFKVIITFMFIQIVKKFENLYYKIQFDK